MTTSRKSGVTSKIRKPQGKCAEVSAVLLEIFAANGRMNQLLLEHLDPRAWRARPLGMKTREGRTIAAIFAHMHNCRRPWLERSAPHLACPSPLDPARCTMKQAAAAHKKSAAQCLRMLKEALSVDSERRVQKFSRGSWARDWPAGATMFGYMFAHDAHHRGQIIALAHQLGYRLSTEGAYGIWWWEKIWKELGFSKGPR
jgi:uncharacterized damage-inducible protein DinB